MRSCKSFGGPAKLGFSMWSLVLRSGEGPKVFPMSVKYGMNVARHSSVRPLNRSRPNWIPDPWPKSGSARISEPRGMDRKRCFKMGATELGNLLTKWPFWLISMFCQQCHQCLPDSHLSVVYVLILSISPFWRWGGWGCEVSCGGHHWQQVEAGPIFSGHWIPYLFFPHKSWNHRILTLSGLFRTCQAPSLVAEVDPIAHFGHFRNHPATCTW